MGSQARMRTFTTWKELPMELGASVSVLKAPKLCIPPPPKLIGSGGQLLHTGQGEHLREASSWPLGDTAICGWATWCSSTMCLLYHCQGCAQGTQPVASQQPSDVPSWVISRNEESQSQGKKLRCSFVLMAKSPPPPSPGCPHLLVSPPSLWQKKKSQFELEPLLETYGNALRFFQYHFVHLKC